MREPTATPPEQIQVFYEIALSIGRGETVAAVARTALSSYLRRLNCSTGGVFERREEPDGGATYDLVAGIPRQPTFNEAFEAAADHVAGGAEPESAWHDETLPIAGTHDGSHYYLFDLPDFGALVVVKNGAPFSEGTLAALTPLHERLADACAGRRAAQEARRARETLRTVVDTIPQEVVVADADGQYRLANEAAAAARGVRVEELEGSTGPRRLGDEGGRGAGAVEQRVIETGDPVRIADEELVDADGGARTVTTDVVPLSVPGEAGRQALVVAADTTERVEREETLERTNTVLRTVLDTLPAGVLVEDPNRDILAVNQRLCDLLDVPVDAGSLVGADCAAAAHDLKHVFEAPEAFVDRVNERIAAREPVTDEPLTLADGRRLERDYVPYELPDGEANLWVYRDVTERAEREAELRETRRRLRRSNRDLEQFAYAASHDLKQPLRTVGNYLTLLEELYGVGSTLDERAFDLVESAVDATGRMQSMIDALLQYSRVDSRGGALEPTPLADVVDKARLNLTVRVEDADATVTADALPTVRGDPRLLVQLFQNLIDNGVKYNDSASPSVHVGARDAVDPAALPEPVADGLDGSREWRHVYVEDDGAGMAESAVERAFDVFERLGRTDVDGTGVGLALCQRIVAYHDGAIWLTSAPGEGTRVDLLLPAPA